MSTRMRILIGSLLIASLASLCGPALASAQTGYVTGGLMFDIRRYASAGEGPKVYDGEPLGVSAGAGVFVPKSTRFAVEFELTASRDATTTITTPVSIAGASPVDFTTTYKTRVQTYSGLFAWHVVRAPHLHLSVRGGATFVHHRREIVPPALLPADPRATTPTVPVVIIDNVAAPALGIDADLPLSTHFAIVAAARANRFTVATDLSAYSIRPMIGARALF